MSREKHTPGPWEREKHGLGIGPVSKSDDQSNGMIIPVAYVDFAESDEIQEANSRLISSAPELLEALKDATCRLDALAIEGEATYLDRKALDKACAAISKATGE